MLKGFKDFLMRGNIVDLAVAVVVGSAFTAVVTAFTNSVIKPVIALAGSGNVQGWGFALDQSKPATFINLSGAINAVITFFITAGVVYFLFVLPMQKIQERRQRGKEQGQADPSDVELLVEIRDLMRRDQGLPTIKGLAGNNGETDTDGTSETNGKIETDGHASTGKAGARSN